MRKEKWSGKVKRRLKGGKGKEKRQIEKEKRQIKLLLRKLLQAKILLRMILQRRLLLMRLWKDLL